MNAYRPTDFVKPANLHVPYGSECGVHYHIAIQFDQQGAHDLASLHYQAAAESAEPGDLRDFCLDRFRILNPALRHRALEPMPN